MKRFKGRRYPDNIPCHLCGFSISQNYVSPDHDLFGTCDHIVPKCAGGSDKGPNRAPAHRLCNQIKGARLVAPELKRECFDAIVRMYPMFVIGTKRNIKNLREGLAAAQKCAATAHEGIPN